MVGSHIRRRTSSRSIRANVSACGLGRKAGRAPKFYGVIVICIVLAVLGNLAGINPIRALVLSQLLNGLAAIPLVFLILHICNDAAVMGNRTNGRLANSVGWLTFGIIVCVGAACVWLLAR